MADDYFDSCNDKPTLQIYFEKKFNSKELDWRVICTLPQKVTTNTYLRLLQYKILNNILYLNENYLSLNFLQHHPAPSAILLVKISHYLFCDCTITQCLWKKLQFKLKDDKSSSTNATDCHLWFP